MEIDLSTNETEISPFEADKELINKVSSILANKLLDFANNGGNIKNITPKDIFGKKEEL